MLLEGKNSLVTGAGSGIGEVTAKRMALEGAKVLVVDINEEGGRRVVDEIVTAGGVAAFHKTDISNADEVDSMVDTAVEKWGGLDLAVNNAGLAERPGLFHELDPAEYHRVLGVDLHGTFYSMRAELAHFVKHGGGAIVNTASGAGLKATPRLTAYSTAKHGIVGLTRTGAMDYVQDNIRVNAVAPGTILTPAMRAAGESQMAEWASLVPMGRMGDPAEIAAAIVWLLSDQASFVTGTVLEVDGGYMQG
ncbi:SDR family oxidoreductase [Microbacterium sp. LRZ72]|uniref:SDR family NAD(P)-dependent oxidoreductase n=1 Tax=Microbacterium sp. LRZ72 TaxID=2942481 RepID=UPI0029B83911|nr:SDR family NAD(P)-dependent oxidoreductase [Microbacterium sp. LRZ72]MDX2376515.1 SDR family oxidoreductase [Microbacterium sp. LRZ72]